MDITHVLLTILLVLLAVIGVGLVIALALAISTILEIFALARTVRKEVAGVGNVLRSIGEGIGDKLGGAFGLIDFLKPAKKVVRPKKKA